MHGLAVQALTADRPLRQTLAIPRPPSAGIPTARHRLMANPPNDTPRTNGADLRRRFQSPPVSAPPAPQPEPEPEIPLAYQRRSSDPVAVEELSALDAAAAHFAGTPLPGS